MPRGSWPSPSAPAGSGSEISWPAPWSCARAGSISRYELPQLASGQGFPQLRGRARVALDARGFERLGDFMLRRGELDPPARARVASRLAAALAARAGVEPPPPAEAEAFLEALVAWHAEGA